MGEHVSVFHSEFLQRNALFRAIPGSAEVVKGARTPGEMFPESKGLMGYFRKPVDPKVRLQRHVSRSAFI